MNSYKLVSKDDIINRISINKNGCWILNGYISKEGYGKAKYKGSMQNAHRVAYIIFKGNIPENYEIDHLCRTRSCCNPQHLEAVTHKVNMLRGCGFAARYAKQTHCHRGHEFTPGNIYLTNIGGRHCRKCRSLRNRIYYVNKLESRRR